MAGRIAIECLFPNEESEQFRVHVSNTVEQVKKHICAHSPSLFGIPHEEFYLGLSKDDIWQDESVTLVSHQELNQRWGARRPIRLVLLPKTHFRAAQSRRSMAEAAGATSNGRPVSATTTAESAQRARSASDRLTGRAEETEMAVAAKKAVFSLKALEDTCMSRSEDRKDTFFQQAKEATVDMHVLMKLASTRNLTSVHDLMASGIQQVMRCAQAVMKDASVGKQSELSGAMKEMGEAIKVFIRAFRASVRKDPRGAASPAPSSPSPISSPNAYRRKQDPDVIEKRLHDGRITKADVQYDNAELEGFLTKQGGNIKVWRRRWCVLKDGFISYFRSQGDEVPLGAVPLEGVEAVERLPKGKGDHAFGIQTPYRTYYLRADTEEQMNLWISSCGKYILSEHDVAGHPSRRSQLDKESQFTNMVEKEGWLTKSGSNGRSWKRRWCVLKDNIIYYFRTERDAQDNNPRGAIPLQDSSVEILEDTAQKKTAAIHTRHRTYKLTSEPQVLHEWLEFIHGSIGNSDGRLHEKRLTRKLEAMKSYQTLTIQYDAAKVRTRILKRHTTEYVNDTVANASVKELLGDTTCVCPDDEILNWKRVMASALVKQTTRKRKSMAVVDAEVTTAPLPPSFPTDFLVYIHFPAINVSKTLKCFPHQTPLNLILQAMDKIKRFTPLNGVNYSERSPNDFIMKIVGRSEYLLNNDLQLHQVVYVRRAINRWHKVEFAILPREDVVLLEDAPSTVAQVDVGMVEEKQRCYPISELDLMFVMRVASVTNFSDDDLTIYIDRADIPATQLYVEMGLYHGGKRIGSVMRTRKQVAALWDQQVQSNLTLRRLPREARLLATLYATNGKVEYPLAWVNFALIDYQDRLRAGRFTIPMIPHQRANLMTAVPNHDSPVFHLNVDFMAQRIPVVWAPVPLTATDGMAKVLPTPEEKERLLQLLQLDPLGLLTVSDKRLLWKCRVYCKETQPLPLVLSKMLLSVDWTEAEQVAEVHHLLQTWPKIPPVNALELLNFKFADSQVRLFAVKSLHKLSDYELSDYLLQLVQALKYETYHNSALSKFLLVRALTNRAVVGHPFFWHLMAEAKSSSSRVTRYTLLLEAYVRGCGQHCVSLTQQVQLITSLRDIATIVKSVDTDDRMDVLHSKLAALELPETFMLPISASLRARGLIPEKCRWLDSITVPLWLAFKNEDPTADQPIYVIFKDGDDLRQDVLTLQMINVMDKVWKQAGSDLFLTPYRCVATGEDMGMIEVVLNSETTADIQRKAGGGRAVFKKTPILNWLRTKTGSEERLRLATQNFIRSLAGYCVATYVLGIGDRHNDNIMLCQSGHLFHIDFAHFLGNIMKFAGIKRERAPFVLTPGFAYVICGKQRPERSPEFKEFVDLCVSAYKIIRQHANTFIGLFQMMLSTGIPELTKVDDLEYLRDAFSSQLSDPDAAKHFTDLTYESLRTKTTQINDWFHILAHPD